MARRVLANYRRGESRRSSLADKLRGHLSPSTPAPRLDAELGPVAAAFEQLSDTDRELLSLVAWEGLDTTQLAATLGCSRNAAGVRLHRARRRLERLIAALSPSDSTTEVNR
ncbi:RNA polymerase sigma factor [Kribbella flavida]|uniref:RNA polymerase sigma factor n=1 Tax=Kribbella flavida TaxID=182640 RepID=UPI001ED91BC5|nr:sigma factor-like helix-turn-helix DNA-binding protein [Kribbella flavida]